jgi:hypothetical protein
MPKGRYTIGGKGTHGCKGYPVVGDTGKVHGCHTTRQAAQNQQAAIYASENSKKSVDEDDPRIGENHDCEECRDSMNKSMDSDTDPITGEEREAVLDPAESPISWGGVFKPVLTKASKPNYGNIIRPRKGEPSNKELYARIVAEAKRKFDVYPSAVANAWVVQEYKRRGGTYKSSN